MLPLARRALKYLAFKITNSRTPNIKSAISQSGLFFTEFYVETYPDVSEQYPDPVDHYVMHGAFNGFNPNPHFDSHWYRENNPDVKAAGINPLWHYIAYGARENRKPSEIFDANVYRDVTGRPADDTTLPFLDFINCLSGAIEFADEDENPAIAYLRYLHRDDFDPHFYRHYYQDAKDLSEVDLKTHFLTVGKSEHRYPNAQIAISALETRYGPLPNDFDEKAYFEHYDNVAQQYPYPGGGIIHYLQFGRAEGTRTIYKESYDAHRLHLMMNRIYDMPDVAVKASEPVRINVLVPAFDFKSMSAGFFGVFQVARFIASCGFRVRLVMFDNFYYNEAEFRDKLRGYPGMEDLFDELEVEYIGERQSPLAISPYDNCVATVWYSAYFAQKIMAMTGNRPFLYLIQDYETNFFPGSTLFCTADDTYSFNFNALFSSKTLQDTFVKGQIGAFGKTPPRYTYFNNACARYLPQKDDFLKAAKKTRKLAFYCRPGVHRNMFELGALALCEAYARNIFDGSWEFYGIGLGDVSIQIAEGVELQQMKRMNLADYQKAVGDFDLGVCLMASPHPSLLPFDLGGSGAVVVTNNFGLKNQAYFDGLCRNVISRDPNLESIVDGIRKAVGLLDDREERYANAEKMRFPDDWGHSFDDSHAAFIKAIFRVAPPKKSKAPAREKKLAGAAE